MSASITNAFIQQYTDEVKLAYQQTQSLLVNTVRTHKNITGVTYTFHKLGAITANTKARGADVTDLDPTSGTVNCTISDFYAPIYLDKLDEIKTNASLRQDYVKSSVAGINRKLDDIIIAAATAGTTTTTTTAGGLTLPKIVEALNYLRSNEAGEGDLFLAIGAKQMGEALQITQLTSSDYMTLKGIMSGQIGSAFGFNWVLSNRLPIVTTTRSCVAYNKNAVGLAIGQDVSTEINYVAQKASWLINSMVSAGAVMIDNAGVVEIPCTE